MAEIRDITNGHERVPVEGRVHARLIRVCTGDSNDGALTIAYRPSARDGLTVGIAFCAPHERFETRKGSQLALDRLHSNPITFPYILFISSPAGSISRAERHAERHAERCRVLGIVLALLSEPYSSRTLVQQETGPSKTPRFQVIFRFADGHGDDARAHLGATAVHVRRPFLGADWLGRVKPWVFENFVRHPKVLGLK